MPLISLEAFKLKLQSCNSVKEVADLYSIVVEQHNNDVVRELSPEDITLLEVEVGQLQAEADEIKDKIAGINQRLYKEASTFDEQAYKSAMIDRLEQR